MTPVVHGPPVWTINWVPLFEFGYKFGLVLLMFAGFFWIIRKCIQSAESEHIICQHIWIAHTEFAAGTFYRDLKCAKCGKEKIQTLDPECRL